MFAEPVCMMACGVNPKRPIDLMKNTLPKTPAMVFPMSPNEYFLKKRLLLFAPTIPMRMLSNEISVSVMYIVLNVRNPYGQLFLPLTFSEQSYKQTEE